MENYCVKSFCSLNFFFLSSVIETIASIVICKNQNSAGLKLTEPIIIISDIERFFISLSRCLNNTGSKAHGKKQEGCMITLRDYFVG